MSLEVWFWGRNRHSKDTRGFLILVDCLALWFWGQKAVAKAKKGAIQGNKFIRINNISWSDPKICLVGEYQGIKILTPQEFLKTIQIA